MEWKHVFDIEKVEIAEELFSSDSILHIDKLENEIIGVVNDSSLFTVTISYLNDVVTGSKCTCGHENCRHAVAVLLKCTDADSNIDLDRLASFQNTVIKHNPEIVIEPEVSHLYCLAMQRNTTRLIRRIVIRNNSSEEIKNAILKVSSDTEMIAPISIDITELASDEETLIKAVPIRVKPEMLITLSERISCALMVIRSSYLL